MRHFEWCYVFEGHLCSCGGSAPKAPKAIEPLTWPDEMDQA